MMDELLTALRYKSEGTDIDFKSAQYRFINGSEDDKGELLKDILAISNAWRDGPGYILLGFKDRRPHPAEVVGISESIDDAKVQQFVHGKVKPKLTFSYEEHLCEGKTVGVITIPKQRRAFYLSHAYGKLKSNVVYVRRGSSTDEAEPPEITAMALADAGRGDVRVDLSVRTITNKDLPDTFALRYLQFIQKLPDYETPRQAKGPFEFDVGSLLHDNREFWREYAEYVRVDEGLILMQFMLRNSSELPLSNTKLEVTVEPLSGQGFEMLAGDDLPEEPKAQWNPLHGHGLRNLSSNMVVPNSPLVVDNGGVAPICHVRLGSLLPGEERRSDTLAIVPLGPGKLRLRFRILAGELRTPHESERVVEATGTLEYLDFGGFKSFMRERFARNQSNV